MTQKEKILKLIIESGQNGISTNELRNATHAVDVPKCVSDLNKIGHGIKSIENGDGTVTYFIEYQQKPQWVLLPSGKYGFVNKGIQVKAKPRGKKAKHYFPPFQEYTKEDGSTGYRSLTI